MSQPFLSLSGVSKSFPGVRALRDVDFGVDRGEVVSLVGQNGAGKSTLMGIVGGIHEPDEGHVSIGGEEVRISNPGAAEELGIALVHQEPTLVPNMTVAANIFLNRERLKGRMFLDFEGMREESTRITRRLGFDIHPDRFVEDLSLVEKEVVEIAKAMLVRPRILILDEVTAPLNADAVERLFEIVAALKAEGIAIIFISHRLDEVARVSNRIVVLRDGGNAGELRPDEGISEKDIISLMLGRKDVVELMLGEREVQPEVSGSHEPAYLAARRLSKAPFFEDVSFAVARGEILGFAGLKGSGVTEMLKTLFGALRKDDGHVLVDGRELAIRRPRDAIKSGIGMLTNDRQLEGLALRRGVEENMTISSLERLCKGGGLLRPGLLGDRASALASNLTIRTPSLSQEVVNLSGGNQQKVVLAKWLLRDLDIVIADEPTRGVDVQAKDEIYKLLLGLKEEGKAMIVYSPEIPELLAICDRIVVVDSGHVVGQVERGSRAFEEGQILRMMHAARSIAPLNDRHGHHVLDA
jgi:ABC-type sugar transport system ATPase subunit